MLVQDNNFYLTSFSIFITFLLEDVWILKGETTCSSLPGVKGLNFVYIKESNDSFSFPSDSN